MIGELVWYHLHSHFSNPTADIDSVTKPEEYIELAKKYNMKAISFSEHGNVYEWVKKKILCDKAGIKYIHGVEMYLTEDKTVKIKDNYHIGLYAKNYEGVKEINKLVSKSSNKKVGNHFYYRPRITFEELKNTSENIIITTACIGGVLARINDSKNFYKDFIKFLEKNKNRCFLEVQHHNIQKQIEYNAQLKDLSLKTGIPLIAGTDTHCLNKKHEKGRSILQKAKKVHFSEEEYWDLTCKSYDELFECFQKQGVFLDCEIKNIIQATVDLSNMVEDFEFDKSFKYPKMSDNPTITLRKKVEKGVIERGVNLYPNFNEEYIPRIDYELETYKDIGMEDFLLLDEDIKNHAKRKNIPYGYSRGSVAGSEVAYLLGLTDVDSIREGLIFERFANKERVSLGDIDTDWCPEDRESIKKYFHNKEGLYCSEIITFNTVALKGSIREVGRALNIPLDEVNQICEGVERNEATYRQLYPELFEYVDIISGTIVSVGVNACGNVVSPIPIDDVLGVDYSISDLPVSCVSKKYIDELNFVKLDVLSLDNLSVMKETCKLAGIPIPLPENLPIDKEKYWKAIRENTLGIFQWESDSATDYIKRLFSDETISKIKEVVEDFQYIDVFSMGNGAIRPAGASYRDELAKGIFRDNGNEALNKFLSPTLGFLVYQEQIIEFLNKFCGFSLGKADIVRRGFAKKTGTEEYIPDIKKGFIKTMEDKFGIEKEESLKLIVNFLQVIEDASDYLFSLNHAKPYSYIGFCCAYLREEYTLEFLTSMLNQFENKIDKTARITQYAKEKNIHLAPPTFRKSRAKYFCDKDTNTIYKGIKSIKFLNNEIAEYLYSLKDETFVDFVDFVNRVNVNKRALSILVKIGYFREFGTVKRLLKVLELFETFKNKTYKKENLNEQQTKIIKMFAGKETEKQFSEVDKVSLIRYLINNFTNETDELPIFELARFEGQYVGSVSKIDANCDKNLCLVLDVNTLYTPKLQVYKLKTGETFEVTVYKNNFAGREVNPMDLVYINSCKQKEKKKYVYDTDGTRKLVPTGEYNLVVTYYLVNKFKEEN